MKDAIIIFLGVLLGTVLYAVLDDIFNFWTISLHFKSLKRNRGDK